ncbi:hypothetical protein [Arenibaculum sp.]|jgi:hypothetical protein|uniref:hypothetical protein n=1 Tax=Arenibaculum sp. TaxID=2865862 RepID=UPI002E11EADF|nr:hypothetical protein [Arenibaculum sp.]
MFVLRREETYEFPVDAKVPNARIPGQHVVHRFHAVFRSLPVERSRALLKAADQAQLRGEQWTGDKDMMREVLAGWRDGEVKGEDGQDLPFTEENLEAMLDNPFALAALTEAYRRSISGEQVQARKRGN